MFLSAAWYQPSQNEDVTDRLESCHGEMIDLESRAASNVGLVARSVGHPDEVVVGRSDESRAGMAAGDLRAPHDAYMSVR